MIPLMGMQVSRDPWKYTTALKIIATLGIPSDKAVSTKCVASSWQYYMPRYPSVINKDQDVAAKALAMSNTFPSVPDAPTSVTPNGKGFAGVSS